MSVEVNYEVLPVSDTTCLSAPQPVADGFTAMAKPGRPAGRGQSAEEGGSVCQAGGGEGEERRGEQGEAQEYIRDLQVLLLYLYFYLLI